MPALTKKLLSDSANLSRGEAVPAHDLDHFDSVGWTVTAAGATSATSRRRSLAVSAPSPLRSVTQLLLRRSARTGL
jgi:hypothetical protein